MNKIEKQFNKQKRMESEKMKDKEKLTINFGIQECSKCQYKLRCEECAYYEKNISELIKFEKQQTRKETAKKIINWFKENSVCAPSNKRINEFAKQFDVEVKEYKNEK